MILSLFFTNCHDGLHDLRITCASTEISGDGSLDLLFRGAGLFIEKALCSEDHPGSAEAALDRSPFNKGLLKGMKFPVSAQALDGDDLFLLNTRRERQTGKVRLSVNEDSACATSA